MIWFVLIFGLFLRLINLNQSLWLDEAITALAVKNNSFIDIVSKFSPGDFHPPLYYLMLKLWTNIFGYSEIALRLPSVIFGILLIGVIYLLAKMLFDQRTAMIAAIFAAVNPLLVYYSQETRMYTLAALFVAVAFLFLLRKRWLLFILSLVLAIYTDYLPILVLPVFFLIAKDKKPIILSYFVMLVLFLPWVYIFIQQLATGLSLTSNLPGWSALSSFSIKDLPLTFVKFIIGRISLDNKIIYGLIMAPVSLLYLWIVSQSKNRLLWLWFLMAPILALIISFKLPIFSYFRLLFVLPAFCLLLGDGIKGNKYLIGLICFVSIICLTIFNIFPRFQREDWRNATKYFESDPGLILIPSQAQSAPIVYYDPKLPLQDKNNLNLTNYHTVYLLRYVQEIFDPEDYERKIIEATGYHRIAIYNFNGIVAWIYQL